MARVLLPDQSYVMGHIVEVLHQLDGNVDALGSGLMSRVISIEGILKGYQDYFRGSWKLRDVANEHNKPVDMSIEASEGIDWDDTDNTFVFDRYGWYLINIETAGDMYNARNDWYQEFVVMLNHNGIFVNRSEITIPPNITKNIRLQSTMLVNVEDGDYLSPITRHSNNGSLATGCKAFITIKRVI